METENYLNTELEIIKVKDLDGELPEEPHGRNILREKTFNSELNSLVNKIFSNEKIGSEPEIRDNELVTIEKNKLLMDCEKLIYRIKHSEDLESISSRYNPFDTDINVYDDIDDTADYIKAGLLQSGYTRYQILKYNFNDKAYRSDINFLDSSYSSDMYFSINDPIISQINLHAEGFIVNYDLIESDPFFSKKFSNRNLDDTTPHSFYIVKISAVYYDSINIKAFENRITRFEEFISPLLIIEIDNDYSLKSSDIFRSLKETATLPLMLYFLKSKINFSFNINSYENVMLMIELFIKSAVNSKVKSYLITLKDYSGKSNLFIFKFALAKMKRIFRRDSLILRISINNALLVTEEQDSENIMAIIDRVNSLEEIIIMQAIDYNVYLSSMEFVNLFL